ncbi:MAG: serine hydrolase, partial [Gemmatimonadota bacterium]|nr:serine hydrolase [Gemmatimonadota bacterium]
MKRFAGILIVLAVLAPGYLAAQQQESYDYWRSQRDMVRYGQQAIFMCNGLFTSNRTIDQVFEQELAYLDQPVGTPDGGDYEIDRARRAVAIGASGGTPVMRAAFREGLGCIILAPDQTFEDIGSLPVLDTPPLEGDPDKIPWPDGDLIEDQNLLPNVNAAILEDASNWAFERTSPEQVTLSLIVVHNGNIIHERY